MCHRWVFYKGGNWLLQADDGSDMLDDSLNSVFSFQGAIHVNDRVVPQPPLQKLSAEKLTREGAFLMDCGSVSTATDKAMLWLQSAHTD